MPIYTIEFAPGAGGAATDTTTYRLKGFKAHRILAVTATCTATAAATDVTLSLSRSVGGLLWRVAMLDTASNFTGAIAGDINFGIGLQDRDGRANAAGVFFAHVALPAWWADVDTDLTLALTLAAGGVINRATALVEVAK